MYLARQSAVFVRDKNSDKYCVTAIRYMVTASSSSVDTVHHMGLCAAGFSDSESALHSTEDLLHSQASLWWSYLRASAHHKFVQLARTHL